MMPQEGMEKERDLAGKFLVSRGYHMGDFIPSGDVQTLLAEFKVLSRYDIERTFKKWFNRTLGRDDGRE
jgi:hypothetical protein